MSKKSYLRQRNFLNNSTPNPNKLSDLQIEEYSPISMASVFSGMLLEPKYQACIYRIEYAITICLLTCKGTKRANKKVIRKINEAIKNTSSIILQEDPVEDIYISSLSLGTKRYNVLLGLWEGCILETQIFLNILDNLPTTIESTKLYKSIEELLTISNLIIEKNNLVAKNNTTLVDSISNLDIKKLNKYQNKIIVNINDVAYENIDSISHKDFNKLAKNEFGNTQLELQPIYINNDKIYFLLPTAVTISIRRQIIKYLNKQNLLTSFLKNHLTRQIQNMKIFREFTNTPVDFKRMTETGSFEYSDAVIEFDSGYYFHFIFIMDTLEDIENNWFAGFSNILDDEFKYIDDLINKTKKRLLKQDENNKGCSLIIPCGFGRSFALYSDFISSQEWSVEFIHLHDLETLNNDISCNPHLIWRIIESKNKFENMGVELMNINGFLNFYGYLKENNNSLMFNFDTENIQALTVIMMPTDSQLELRKEVHFNTNYINTVHPTLGHLVVRKGFSDSLFNTNYRSNLYIDNKKDINTFRVVYVNPQHTIWLEQDIKDNIEFGIQFQVYESVISWFCKILVVLNKYNIPINKNLKIWKINFQFPKDISSLEKDISKEEVLNSFSNNFLDISLHTTFTLSLMKGFMFEQNYSEQAIILSFLEYVWSKELRININTLLLEIIGNEDARHTHFLMAQNYRDYFGLDREEPIYVETIDEGNIKLNLGWSTHLKDDGNRIRGKQECKNYLSNIVEAVWGILKTKLVRFDREDLVKKLLSNIELCDHQTKKWKRTFKANLSLQDDKDNVYDVATEKIGRLNIATLSSRLVIEMSICESSVNCGKKAAKLDIQELLCLASILHHVGNLSEAINYDAIPSEINISNFGDILFDHSFNNQIVRGYGFSIQKEQLNYSITTYGENFVNDIQKVVTKNTLDEKFESAFIDEFSYSIEDAGKFISFIENLGFEKNKLVFSVEYDELIDSFDEDNRDILTVVLDSFIIYSRRNWTKIPEPYKKSDWQPWKFKRRYSVSMKPIVQVDAFENIVTISPQLVKTIFLHLVYNCYEANLDENIFQSKQLKYWIGHRKHERGMEFEIDVLNRLKELGFEARQGITLPEILKKKMQDYGDIDVLAWDKENNIVYPIECKSLEFAKTDGEIAKQLYEFKGLVNERGKNDRLLKHIKRLNELENDINGLAKFTNLDTDLTIKGLIVFSNIVPMSFNDTRLHKDKIEFLKYDDLHTLQLT